MILTVCVLTDRIRVLTVCATELYEFRIPTEKVQVLSVVIVIRRLDLERQLFRKIWLKIID